ncbi:ABC transporter permease subunit, partial [Geminicoccus flavidas]|uniref:ABC transporter permease subunit n=1 Tax=Geminicoccus flavidas TaxID=2506407 RepID=UPI0038B3AB27
MPHEATHLGYGAMLRRVGAGRLGGLIALVALIVIASLLSDRFLTVPNLLNVLRQIAIVGILAMGMTFVILTAGIDLSIGSILGLSVVLYAGLLESWGLPVAITLGML